MAADDIMDAEEFREELASTRAGRIMLEALDQLSDGVTIWGPGWRSLYSNASSRQRSAKVFEQLGDGLDMMEALRVQVRASMPHYDARQVDEAARWILEKMEDGSPIEMRANDGSICRVVYEDSSLGEGWKTAISVDVSEIRRREHELKQARREAEAASEAKSSFLANTSHEIRTPLNAILGLTEVLTKHDLPPAVQEHLAAINDSGKTLNSLLNDLLDLSKIEAGRLEVSPVDTDLAHAVRRVHKLWKSRAEDKGIRLSVMLDSELPAVMNFDPVRVRQCVSNLISNAIKFTETGGVDVAVRAERNGAAGGHLVTVTVADTGIGIDEAAQERLFEPFVQADASTSRRFGGTGLGLNISRNLAQLMGGDLTLVSTLGRGSTFTLTFEANDASGASSEASAGRAPLVPGRMRGLRVLVVDDIPINRQVTDLFLTPLGCEVVEAGNGKEALDALAGSADPFDVVLLDGHMPVMDGAETIARIRSSDEAWAAIPVVALTADVMSGDRDRYLAMGMDGYLPKPISEATLIEAILRATDASTREAATG